MLAALPPGYGCLFDAAYGAGDISESMYAAQHQVRWFLELPARTLLAPTRFDGALQTTHQSFGASLVALVLAGWAGWLLLLLAGGWVVAKITPSGRLPVPQSQWKSRE